MSEKSNYGTAVPRELPPVRVQYSNRDEWFREGGPKGIYLVGVNGDPTRYPAGMHDSA